MNFRYSCCAAALLALPALALAQTPASAPSTAQISTLAGSCGAWTIAAHAKLPGQKPQRVLLTSPEGLALDGRGRLYVSDPNGGISKIELATGNAANLTGTDTEGFADGMPAVAQFAGAGAMVLDGKGMMYVADYRNHRIRRVVLATGRVSTLAGSGTAGPADGTGAQAQLNYPAGLALDGRGNLYVSEIGSSAIRRIVLSTGAVSTVAGNGQSGFADGVGKAARFNSPQGLAFDRQGNLYVADAGNHRIRKLVLATGAVSTVAGGTEGYADGVGAVVKLRFPKSIALDGKGNLYVADASNACIRQLVLATGAVSTVVGNGKRGYDDGTGPAARLQDPKAVVADGQGHLYVADHNCVRQVKL